MNHSRLRHDQRPLGLIARVQELLEQVLVLGQRPQPAYAPWRVQPDLQSIESGLERHGPPPRFPEHCFTKSQPSVAALINRAGGITAGNSPAPQRERLLHSLLQLVGFQMPQWVAPSKSRILPVVVARPN